MRIPLLPRRGVCAHKGFEECAQTGWSDSRCVRTDHPVRDFNGTGIILDVASTPPREEGNAELLAVCALTSLIALTYPLNSRKSLKRRGVWFSYSRASN